jgi:hypothetical protein
MGPKSRMYRKVKKQITHKGKKMAPRFKAEGKGERATR